jgi:hypothetical protein
MSSSNAAYPGEAISVRSALVSENGKYLVRNSSVRLYVSQIVDPEELAAVDWRREFALVRLLPQENFRKVDANIFSRWDRILLVLNRSRSGRQAVRRWRLADASTTERAGLRMHVRTLALAALCGFLGACAGVPEARPVHEKGLCMHVERDTGDLLTMRLCNCSGRLIRLEQDEVPWTPLGLTGFRLTFDGELIPIREPGFVDAMPFSFYQIPAGECLDGLIRLDDAFVIDGRDLRAPGWVLHWSGTIRGDREFWTLDFDYQF